MSQQPPPQSPGSSPPTQPLPPAGGPPAGGPPAGPPFAAAQPPPGPPPHPGAWQRATSSSGGRWGLAVVAVVVALFLLGSVAVAGVLVGRATVLRGENVRGPFGYHQRDDQRRLRPGPGMPGMPGMPGGRLPGLGNGAAHGEYTAPDVNGQPVTLLFQSGQVTAVSPTSITLKSADGFTQTYVVNAQTRVRGGSIGSMAPGDTAVVLAVKDTRTATVIAPLGTRGGSGPSQ
jgi:hypothetical protein